jgi:hypothetical protein
MVEIACRTRNRLSRCWFIVATVALVAGGMIIGGTDAANAAAPAATSTITPHPGARTARQPHIVEDLPAGAELHELREALDAGRNRRSYT